MIKHTLNDLIVMAMTIYGEARGESQMGQYAVGCVIYNRYKKQHLGSKSIEHVCLKPWQFSCWNENDPNRRLLTSTMQMNEAFYRCLHEATYILQYGDNRQDITLGSLHYHSVSLMDNKPKWAIGKEPVKIIGRHVFYNNID